MQEFLEKYIETFINYVNSEYKVTQHECNCLRSSFYESVKDRLQFLSPEELIEELKEDSIGNRATHLMKAVKWVRKFENRDEY